MQKFIGSRDVELAAAVQKAIKNLEGNLSTTEAQYIDANYTFDDGSPDQRAESERKQIFCDPDIKALIEQFPDIFGAL